VWDDDETVRRKAGPMPRHVDDRPVKAERKQSRPTRSRGKAGYRRFEAVLEAANIVVQRVETENDIGRDAFVDIVDGTDVTGGVVCVQIKSGRSTYFYNDGWVVPGTPADFTLWRESTVPFFGVVHDEQSDALRWVDLSEAAALDREPYLSPVVSGPFGKRCVPVPDGQRLDLEIDPFLAAAELALRRRSGVPVAALLSDDVERVSGAIVDVFAMGRHDSTAFLLLGALLHRLPGDARRVAVDALAMTTPHPDVLWTKGNWIPERVGREVQERMSWGASDIAALLAEIDDEGIQRGSYGQTIYYVLKLDREVESKLFRAALDRALADDVRFWAAAIALYIAYEEAPALLELLVSADAARDEENEALFPLTRSLRDIRGMHELAQFIDENGYVIFF
jgi:hypothetical protein